MAGLVKKIKGKFSLTKNGTILLKPQNRLQLFKTVIEAFTERFMWSYSDGYQEHPIGQKGLGVFGIMLTKFGDQLPGL